MNLIFKPGQWLGLFVLYCVMTLAHAGIPVWAFTPSISFPPQVAVSASGTATVQYTITNNSLRLTS